jgi:hypothetical protein
MLWRDNLREQMRIAFGEGDGTEMSCVSLRSPLSVLHCLVAKAQKRKKE